MKMVFDLQLLGGRGANLKKDKHNVNKPMLLQEYQPLSDKEPWGVPKNKRKSVRSLEKQIKKHESKIEIEQNSQAITHWQKEIRGFKRDIQK